MFELLMQVNPSSRRRRIPRLQLVCVLILALEWCGLANGLSKGRSLRKCDNFDERRLTVHPGFYHPDYDWLTIPANLSSRGEALTFTLIPGNLKCEDSLQEIEVKWEEHGLIPSPSSPHAFNWSRSFYEVEEAGKNLSLHFTRDGHFFDGQYFLHPETDYCVKSLSEDKLELLYCPQNCDAKAKRESGSQKNSRRICLPKCCAIDEVLTIWERKCVKLEKTLGGEDPPYWKPELYSENSNGRYSKLSQVDFRNSLKYSLAYIPAHCNIDPEAIAMMMMENETVHWTEEDLEHSSEDNTPYLRWHSSAFVEDKLYPNESIPKDHIRLAVDKYGNVRPLHLYHSRRKWIMEENVQFCTDAFIVEGDNSTGSGPQIIPNRFFIFSCVPPEEMQEEESHLKAVLRSTVYTGTSLLSMPFLFANVIIYFCLLDKLNLHGLTILSYSIAELMSFSLLISAHFIFLLPLEDFTGPSKAWSCYLLAVSAHYFFFCSYFWMTMMNVDLWMTFKSLRVVKRDSKEWKKFALYSSVAWGLPLIIIASFVTVNHMYSDPATLVPVPDYGTTTCFVSPDFRGYYVHLPVAIIIFINIILILLTMKIFFDARRQNKATMGDSSARVNATKYSAKLFAKLFIVMGGTSLVDYLSWYYTSEQENKPWAVVILESITYLVPIVLFVLFCLNDRTLKQLEERFPRFTGYLKPLGRIFKKDEDSSGSTDTTATTDLPNSKGEKIGLKSVTSRDVLKGQDYSSTSSSATEGR